MKRLFLILCFAGVLLASSGPSHAQPTGDTMVSVLGGKLPPVSELKGDLVGDFQIGKTEVTLGQWKIVRDWAASHGYRDLAGVGAGTGDNYPVTNVSWYDVVKWCNAKSEKEGMTPVYQVNGATYKTGQSDSVVKTSAQGYRLPTEAEWEWAARGGRQTHGYTYSGGNTLNAVSWWADNAKNADHEVGTKAANELGIFDMSGNAWEWCWDWNPGEKGSRRVLRGGGWNYGGAKGCAVAFRRPCKPEVSGINMGFRLAGGIAAQAPAITLQPASASVKAGAPVTFSVAVSNAAGVTYQWSRNGISIAGATQNTYSIPSAQASNAGDYTVSVSSVGGVTKSAVAFLLVAQPPAITRQPASASVKAGAPVTFSVAVSNVTGVTYQWSRNGQSIAGATAKDFSIIAARLTDAGTYSVSVSNSAGSVTSAKVNLAVTASTVSSSTPAGMVSVQGGTMPDGSALKGQVVADFQIGKTEATWGDWKTVRDWAVNNGYSDLANVGAGTGDNYPVTDVSWYDVVKWCNARSQKEGKTPVYQLNGAPYKTGQSNPTVNVTANGYRLPTEAEWEWAARGGRQTHGYTYSGSNDLNTVGWTYENSGGVSHEVGKKAANELGIYDMSGNMWEWCWDSVSGYAYRRFRGGSWYYGAGYATVSYRDSGSSPDNRNICVGFRLACSSGQ